MKTRPNKGDQVYAGYPTAHIKDFKWDNKKKKLKLGNIKHLLWGDWIQVTDYNYAEQGEDAANLTASAKAQVKSRTKDLVSVRARGCSGYMALEDLQEQRLLEIVFVDVGQGDGALMVTPDDKKFVVDAGKGDNMFRYLNWRFSGFKKAMSDFEALIVTHPDNDHYLGFSPLVENAELQANHLYHNGLMEQFSVTTSGAQSNAQNVRLGKKRTLAGQSYLTGLIATDKALRDHLARNGKRLWINDTTQRPKQYPELLDKAQKARVTGSNKRRFPKIGMLSTAHGEKHDGKSYLPGFGPDNALGCVIQIIGPVVEHPEGTPTLRVFNKRPTEATTTMDLAKTKNGHSVLLKLTYGKVSVFFGGDLNSSAEMFLLSHYTGLNVFDPAQVSAEETVQAARPIFQADVTKACHHGSADFTDNFLSCVHPAATVISSGDQESHAHPRSDTLGAIGHHGRGHRSLIFSTELARSTREFTDLKDIPAVKAEKLRSRAKTLSDRAEAQKLLAAADKLDAIMRKRNVTVYGAINFRADKDKVVMAYMLENPSKGRRWDVYTLESSNGGVLRYLPVKEAEKAEAKRRRDG